MSQSNADADLVTVGFTQDEIEGKALLRKWASEDLAFRLSLWRKQNLGLAGGAVDQSHRREVLRAILKDLGVI